MKRCLIAIMILSFLTACQAMATVEDTGIGSDDVSGNTWNGPSTPSLPTYLPSPCSGDSGSLSVSISITGPESEPDKSYTTQGKPLDFIVTIKNSGETDAETEVNVKPEGTPLEWFSWTTTSIQIPAGATRSQNLEVLPDINADAGEYSFAVEASAKCRSPGEREAKFKVQAFDYASETSISGSGNFQINKDLSSMKSGIKSTKNVAFSGTVDALVKNEYMVDQARGKNANFQEENAVDNYRVRDGPYEDALVGTESFKSSAVFGGVGSKVKESYNLQQMESKIQDFTLHQTGSLKKSAEFKTADNFTGTYLIDARQTIPGQKSLKELEEYFGSFEINRRILFRDDTKSKAPCQEADCFKAPSVKSPSGPTFTSPCLSGSCNDFVNRLNTFTKPA
jgi:hypothetical protein